MPSRCLGLGQRLREGKRSPGCPWVSGFPLPCPPQSRGPFWEPLGAAASSGRAGAGEAPWVGQCSPGCPCGQALTLLCPSWAPSPAPTALAHRPGTHPSVLGSRLGFLLLVPPLRAGNAARLLRFRAEALSLSPAQRLSFALAVPRGHCAHTGTPRLLTEKQTGLCLETQLCVGPGLKHPLGFLCPSLGYSKAREGHAVAACTAVLQLLQVKPAALWGPAATSPPPVDGFFWKRLAAGFAMAWDQRNNVNIKILLFFFSFASTWYW